jgi:hypothetical protein
MFIMSQATRKINVTTQAGFVLIEDGCMGAIKNGGSSRIFLTLEWRYATLAETR